MVVSLLQISLGSLLDLLSGPHSGVSEVRFFVQGFNADLFFLRV